MLLVSNPISFFAGYSFSIRLPEFTETEKLLIKGTADFFALNMYSAFLIEHQEFPPEVDWNYMTDQRMKQSSHPSWPKGKPRIHGSTIVGTVHHLILNVENRPSKR